MFFSECELCHNVVPRVLFVLVGWLLASALLAVPVRVEFAQLDKELHTAEPISGSLLIDVAGVVTARKVHIPGEVVLELPARATARLSVEADALWAPERVVLPSEDSDNKVTFEFLGASALEGRLTVPRGHALPEHLEVFFEPSDSGSSDWKRVGAGPQVRQTCTLSPEGDFECLLPTLILDFHLHAPGFVPRYFWAVALDAGSPERLGEVALRPGASVVGRVVTSDGLPPPAGATVLLEPDIPSAQQSVRSQTKVDRRGRRGLVDRRGFFQLQDVAPGSYRVRIEKSGYATTASKPFTVYGGRETALLDPLVLHPPLEFELVLEPAMDPYGRPWKVDLAPVGSDEKREEPVPEDGRWSKEGLAPGAYGLSIRSGTGRYEYSWWVDQIQVEPGMAPYRLELPILQVEGEVTLGDEPLEALVWFGGPHGGRQIRVDTDEEGFYACYLPEPGLWRVTVVSQETGQRNLKAVEIEPLEGARVARVDLHLPDTRILGEVVDGDGDPVPDAQVKAFHLETQQDLDNTQSDSQGEFELRGMAEGSVALSAHEPRTGKSSSLVQIQVQEDLESPAVRLVLEDHQELEGRVSWQGRAVPGAQVTVFPRLPPGTGSLAVFPTLYTDADGRFSVQLPAGSVGANVTVMPPGFAVAMLSIDLPSEAPLEIQVTQEGGTLVILVPESQDLLPGQARRASLLHHEGTQVVAEFLSAWGSYHGVEQVPGRLTLPMMEPGNYTYCVPDPAGKGPPRCASGFLPPGGELTLQVKKESTPSR